MRTLERSTTARDEFALASVIAYPSDHARIRVTGELDMATGPQLVRFVRRLAENGHPNVTLDLHGLRFVDARGLAALVTSHMSCRNEHGALTVTGCNHLVLRMLAVTRMSDLLTVR